MDLSIIIVSYNTKKLLADCLTSVFTQTKDLNYEVIVVDNGSTDESVKSIKQLANYELRVKDKKNNPQSVTRNQTIVKLIENKENLGFAKANNQALRQIRQGLRLSSAERPHCEQAQGEYVLLLNSDTKIVDNALKKLVDFAKGKEELGVVGPKLLNPDGTPQPSVAPFFTLSKAFIWLMTGDRFLYSSPSRTRQVDWVMGAALMVKKDVIKKVGLLDEKFFMYMEEVDWCYRIKKAGFEIWFYPQAEIFHLVRGGSPEGKQKAILNIYQGLIYFYQKHFGRQQLAVLKSILLAKAVVAWLIGILSRNVYLKETYGKAFKLVHHV